MIAVLGSILQRGSVKLYSRNLPSPVVTGYLYSAGARSGFAAGHGEILPLPQTGVIEGKISFSTQGCAT